MDRAVAFVTDLPRKLYDNMGVLTFLGIAGGIITMIYRTMTETSNHTKVVDDVVETEVLTTEEVMDLIQANHQRAGAASASLSADSFVALGRSLPVAFPTERATYPAFVAHAQGYLDAPLKMGHYLDRVVLMRRADDELLVFEERFWSGIDLAQLYREGNQAVADGQPPTGVESLFRAGFKEFSRLSQQADIDADAILEGSRRAMRVALMRETDRIEQHLPFLASVGSTSPYIGLLGTVWGIMHSFRGLANATQATLATVAPGISEALIATAMGLFAAIPAVLAYNRLAARSDALLNRYETFLDEFSGILQRQTYALKANQSQRP